MKFSEFPKKQRITLIAALCVSLLMLAVLLLDFTGVWRGISDIFPFLLGVLLVLVAYIRKNRNELGMTRFYLICGILLIILSAVERVLMLIYK